MRRHIWRLRPQLWWRGGVDIVVAHAPPLGVGDGEDLCHRGFESFRWLIRKYRPAYFIHGHIHRSFAHPAERIATLNGTRVINTYGYFLLDIENPPGAAPEQPGPR
jgi:Icc-related predicted phosphoesterase